MTPEPPRFEPVEDGQVLPMLGGLRVIHTPGHTPGSSVIVLSDGGEQAMLLGDIVHCPLELMDDDFNLLADFSVRLNILCFTL